MRLGIQQARPTSLNDAMRQLGYGRSNRAEKSKLENQGINNAATASSAHLEQKAKQSGDDLQQLKSMVERLEKNLEKDEKENKPRGYKTFFMLNSTEHEFFPAHKY